MGQWGEYGPMGRIRAGSEIHVWFADRGWLAADPYLYSIRGPPASLIRKEVRPIRGALRRDLVGYRGLCMEIQNSMRFSQDCQDLVKTTRFNQGWLWFSEVCQNDTV